MGKLVMKTTQECPLCGSEMENGTLEELGLPVDVLEDVKSLREQGKLTQAIFLAVKIVRTVKDNPQWVKELMDEQTLQLTREFSKQLSDGKSQILKALYELVGNPLRGRIQEASIAQRLKAVEPKDTFTTENSLRQGEDIKCIVREGEIPLGTIIVESKKVNRWNSAFIDQIKDYMKTENTQYGILATTAMPSDALSYSIMMDDILVVNVDYIETAYHFMRAYLSIRIGLEADYNSRVRELQVDEQVMQEIRAAVNDGELDAVIEMLRSRMDQVDKLVNDCSGYMDKFYTKVKRETGDVRELVTKLIADHIDVIRSKLTNA